MIYTKENPFYSVLKKRELLNSGSSKKTYHLVLEVDPQKVPYKVGDSIGILPKNHENVVAQYLKRFDLIGNELIFDKRSKKSFSSKEYFSSKVNLQKPTLRLLKLIEKTQTDQKPLLASLLKNENRQKLKEWMENIHILQILHQFKPKLSYDQLADCFLPLLPRFYSISSSPCFCGNEMHLLVTELKYKIDEMTRYGVGSHYLCETAKIGELIPLYIQPTPIFTLPEDPSASIIMIGPGTGIAPFRAFLQERLAKKHLGKNWLFFGERNQKCDFYYKDFLLKLEKQSILKLDTAFSRDQKEKIYVQMILYQKKEEIWRWIQEGSYIYVCGDAKKMAKQVNETFLKIVQEMGQFSMEQAKDFLKNLRRQKRYLMDVY